MNFKNPVIINYIQAENIILLFKTILAFRLQSSPLFKIIKKIFNFFLIMRNAKQLFEDIQATPVNFKITLES
jgi:hypothetical protein